MIFILTLPAFLPLVSVFLIGLTSFFRSWSVFLFVRSRPCLIMVTTKICWLVQVFLLRISNLRQSLYWHSGVFVSFYRISVMSCLLAVSWFVCIRLYEWVDVEFMPSMIFYTCNLAYLGNKRSPMQVSQIMQRNILPEGLNS